MPKISNPNLEDLSDKERDNSKQVKKYAATKKIDKFSFDVPLHENVKAEKIGKFLINPLK